MREEKWNFNNSYIKLPKLFFTKQYPTPVRAPEPIIFNRPLADSLGAPLQPEVFAGNTVPEGADPLAQAYAGHQFGYFTMLGDGRALLLGEQITGSGGRFDIQLKGSGRTAYSRGGDGRAAAGPMLREYIISEAMHALNIPTTRSLAVMSTGETVIREKNLPGAVLTRVASSHIRVGTFEYASRFGAAEDVRSLADYTIARHFSDIAESESESESETEAETESENKYLLMLKETVRRQASLIAKWQLAGFIHGVMNTDNMAVSGETIDYGPCAFMDAYGHDTVFSSIDTHGRYAYGNQPKAAAWNLARFAEALLPLLDGDENEAVRLGREEIANLHVLYREYWLAGMGAKLGLYDRESGDELLIAELLELMQQFQADYTNTFRSLTLGGTPDKETETPGKKEGMDLFSVSGFHNSVIRWNERWQTRLDRQAKSKDEITALMKSNNPAVIPRNHAVEEALDAAGNGDLSVMDKLLRALSNPYAYTPEQEEYSKLPESASCCYKTFCGT